MHGAGGHHLDPLARLDLAVDDPDVGHHAPVDVVDRVEDHRPGRLVGAADRWLELPDDLVEQVRDALAGLAGDPQAVARVAADQVGELLGVLVGLRGREVDLVEHRDDRHVVLERQVEVGEGLRLDPLRGVDQQHRALAGGQAARHLVGEVDVSRGVDHVQDERVAGQLTLAHLPRQAHGLALDGDAALPLDVHAVEVLRAHLPGVDHPGQLQHPIGQRRLAMVDVGDDAEVADPRRWGRTGAEAGVERGWHRRPFRRERVSVSMIPRRTPRPRTDQIQDPFPPDDSGPSSARPLLPPDTAPLRSAATSAVTSPRRHNFGEPVPSRRP